MSSSDGSSGENGGGEGSRMRRPGAAGELSEVNPERSLSWA